MPTRTKYRRLHVIVGDANLAEIATFLKVGVTALVLAMIEDNFLAVETSGWRTRSGYPFGVARHDDAHERWSWPRATDSRRSSCSGSCTTVLASTPPNAASRHSATRTWLAACSIAGKPSYKASRTTRNPWRTSSTGLPSSG